jgi:hypothetical protein
MDEKKYKYHDAWASEQERKDMPPPFISLDDPYEATKEDILRAKWLKENKILHGDFKPA